MSRNGSGTFTIANTFTSGTRVLVADVNTNFSDIATALTGSLALDGQSAMTGQFKGAAGAVSAPGWSWANELGSGWYRAGAGDFRYSVSGADVVKITSAGMTITGTLTATLGTNSVVTASITDANVTTAKLADGSVTPAKLSTGAPSWDSSGNLTAGGTFTAGGAISDSKGDVRRAPINYKTGDYTLVIADAGGTISGSGARNFTIPANVFSAGDLVTFVNWNSTNNWTLTQGSGLTLIQAGNATVTTGNRTLANNGVATLVFMSATVAYISGAGLS